MPIPMTEYVSITSAVGGTSQVSTRQLIANMFTTDTKVDPLVPLSFDSLADGLSFFGASSEEYLRMTPYFGYVSPAVRNPSSIMVSRYVDADSPCRIFGVSGTYALATFTAMDSGSITFDFDGTEVTVSGVDLSSATSLTDVADLLETAFQLETDGHLDACSVEYDATNAWFTFTASSDDVSTGTFSVSAVTGSGIDDLATALGWLSSAGALVISSAVAQEPVEAFSATIAISNNFGSFCFTDGSSLSTAQKTAVATANAALNVMFMYSLAVSPTDYATISAALISIAGVALTYELATLTEYPDMIPMAIQAATDYTQRNGVMNYMYRQLSGYTASVTESTTKALLDAARVNYYGETQTAGQDISFYQPGVLCGLATSPQHMNIFSNEQWLKDYVAAAILNLQLALPNLSAGQVGRGQILTIIQDAITTALFNGTIIAGKALTTTQKIYITNTTGDDLAWQQVQSAGYWFDVSISSEVDSESGLTIYTAAYTLIYSKNDSVRKVTGTHVLI